MGQDPGTAKALVDEIHIIAGRLNRTVRIMEVCGTHTVALRKTGVHSLLPTSLRLVSGPGCPVCVTPAGYIDNALRLIEEKSATVVTFGDMMRVNGSRGYPLSRHAGDGRARVVYSSLDALEIAAQSPGPVVFLGVGFETTIPTVAAAFLKALESGPRNLFLYAGFKTMPEPLKALLADPDLAIDGLLLPGHVSAVIGRRAYLFLEEAGPRRSVPGVIAGFEPLDLLRGILALLQLIFSGGRLVSNSYSRVVKEEGNPLARRTMETLLIPADSLWRGLGRVPGSGMRIRDEYRRIDAEKLFGLPPVENRDPPGCLCGDVIRGKAVPRECGLFGSSCTPEAPVGPCMVSSEGTCAAHARYGEIRA